MVNTVSWTQINIQNNQQIFFPFLLENVLAEEQCRFFFLSFFTYLLRLSLQNKLLRIQHWKITLKVLQEIQP